MRMNKTLEVLQRDAKVIAESLHIRFYPMSIEEGEGVTVKDADANVYLDFLSGWSVAGTGHRHPTVVEVIKRQVDKFLRAIITEEHVNSACEILEQAIKDVEAGKVSDVELEKYKGW